jgi:hypothetical protein
LRLPVSTLPRAGRGRLFYWITRLAEPQACLVPVRPGTEGDCSPPEQDLDDRTEPCATDAWWLLGDLVICDQHLRYFLQHAGDDYDAMLAEYQGQFPDVDDVPNDVEQLAWSDRPRHDLKKVHRTSASNTGGRRWRQAPGGSISTRTMRRRCGR